jgi:uncharacterized integral membrane protein (TIGR00698 family)
MATNTPLPGLSDKASLPASSSTPAETSSLLGLLPGIAMLAAVGYVGKFIEHTIAVYGKTHHLTLPNIEYVLWAILFGILIANTAGLHRIFRSGVATYEFWLKAGIILLGARFVLGDILKLSGISLVLIFVAFALSFVFMNWLGRAFSLSPRLTTLLSVGSSICGVSAIIATQGALDADEEDSSTAIAAILALGAISLFTFPLIGHALHLSDHAYGLWAGLAVDNTAEATAAGALYSDAAGKFAVLAKTCRNALIGFVVLAVALQYANRLRKAALASVNASAGHPHDQTGDAGETAQLAIAAAHASPTRHAELDHKAAFLWHKFPKFVLGFLFISLLATLGGIDPRLHPQLAALIPLGFSKPQLTALGNLSRWAFLLTFAGVGLRTNLKDLFKQGARPFLVGAVGEIAIATLTLGLVLIADHVYHL